MFICFHILLLIGKKKATFLTTSIFALVDPDTAVFFALCILQRPAPHAGNLAPQLPLVFLCLIAISLETNKTIKPKNCY